MDVVVLIGSQGAGKSILYRTHFAETHIRISKDNFRHNKNPKRRQQTLVKEALEQGHSVVIDNTNPTRLSRTPFLAIAKEYGATVIGYCFETSLHDCLKRNRERGGKRRVPDIALFVTANKLDG